MSGQVVAIGPDGVERWRYSPSAAYYNSLRLGGGEPRRRGGLRVRTGTSRKLNAERHAAWQIEFLGGDYMNELESTYSAPLVDADGRIYLGLGTGKRWTRPWGKVLRAYTPAGALLWEFPLGEGVYTSSPALAPDGTLYVGSMDGKLYALGDAAPPPPANDSARSASTRPRSSAAAARRGRWSRCSSPPPAPGGHGDAGLGAAGRGLGAGLRSRFPRGATIATFKAAAGFVTQPDPAEVCGIYAGTTQCADR